jgi:hypothetical protein
MTFPMATVLPAGHQYKMDDGLFAWEAGHVRIEKPGLDWLSLNQLQIRILNRLDDSNNGRLVLNPLPKPAS